MKATINVLVVIMTLFVAAICLYRWDSETNRGYTWGYWGQLNTVSNSLAKLPGINITEAHCNADVTLEEFEFRIVIASGDKVHLYFGETDPVRKLSGQALSERLREIIERELSNKPQAAGPGGF